MSNDPWIENEELVLVIRTDEYVQLIRGSDLRACRGWPWEINKTYKNGLLLTSEKTLLISNVNVLGPKGSGWISKIINLFNVCFYTSIETENFDNGQCFDFVKSSLIMWALKQIRRENDIQDQEKNEKEEALPQWIRQKPPAGGWSVLLSMIERAQTVGDILKSLKIYKNDVGFREVAEAVEESLSSFNSYYK